MAHFRGTIQGMRGETSRLGTKESGLTVNAASWHGEVTTRLFHANDIDMVDVSLRSHGKGERRTLYRGPVTGPEKERYTLEAGRAVYRDGEPFFHLGKAEGADPTEVDAAARRIVDLLNMEGV